MLSNIRVILTCKQKAKPDGTEASFQLSQADEPTDVFMTIVIAEEQNLEAKPKKSMLELLEFVKVLDRAPMESCQPCSLLFSHPRTILWQSNSLPLFLSELQSLG